MAVGKSAPRYDVWVMMVLGIITGMLGYLLWFYASASLPVGGLKIHDLGFGGPGAKGSISGSVGLGDPGLPTGSADVLKYAWYASPGSAMQAGAYVRNTSGATKNVKVQFVALPPSTNPATCLTTTTGQTFTRSLTNGADKYFGTANFSLSGAALVVGCILEPADMRDVISIELPVVPSVQTPGLIFNAKNISSSTTSGNMDNFGVENFGSVNIQVCPPGFSADADRTAVSATCTKITGPLQGGVTRLFNWFAGPAYAAHDNSPECRDTHDNDADRLFDQQDDGCLNGQGVYTSNKNLEWTPPRPECPGTGSNC